MKFIHNLSEWVYKVEKVLAIILGSLILVSLALGVLYRYVLSSPLSWSDEIAIFALAWLTFIGGSMTIKTKKAPTIDILMENVNGGIKHFIIILSYLVSFLFVCYIFYLSITWLSSPNILIQRSSSMQLPMIIPYLSIPVSFSFMIVHSLDLLLHSILANREVE